MKASEIIKTCVKKKYQDKAHVRAIIPDKYSWWHVHKDEEIPTDKPIQIIIRY